MTRLAVLTVLAVLPAGGAAQRGDWPMPAKDYAATRYSDLTEITGANAGRLRPVWSFSTGVLGGHEGQPLVVDHTMYVVTPYPNVLYAFDLTREGYPLKWKYRPAVDPNAVGIACCDVINRGAFYAEGRIVYNLLDGHTVAIDATTGKELWNARIADVSQGETTPMAPLVVKNRVLVGASGGEFGIHGWLKALDLPTDRRRARVGIPVHAARQLGLRRDGGDDSRGPDDRRPAAPGPRALRQERLRLHAGPRDRGGARSPAVRRRQLGEGRRPRDRAAGARFHQAHGSVPGQRQGRVSYARGREEPRVTGRVFAPHRAVLRPDEQHVHGLPSGAGHPHRRHPVHRCEHAVPRRPWCAPGRVHRLGRSRGTQGVGDQGKVSGLEWCTHDGRGRRVVRHPGRLAQGGQCENRHGAVEVQGGIGRGREPDHVRRAGWQAICGGLRRHRRRLVLAFGGRPR